MFTARPSPPVSEEPKPAVIQRPEPFKADESFEKPYLPSKPVPHSPKITPSSIPNPNPSVTANKAETGFPNYGGFLYNIPGYSAFQPVNFSNSAQPPPAPMQMESSDFKPFQPITRDKEEEKVTEEREVNRMEGMNTDVPKQLNYEEHIANMPAAQPENTPIESKMSITSLAQGSGATVTIPTQINKDTKKKAERYSLKTSIPISKIDMKCVNTPVDTSFQSAVNKPVFNPTFQKESIERPKVEIQSNIVIKNASTETDNRERDRSPVVHSNNISTLLNAAEAINKSDGMFRVPEPKDVPKEIKDGSLATPTTPALIQRSLFNQSKDVVPVVTQPVTLRPMFNPVNAESNKQNFLNKPPDGGYYEQKNQLMFIQNKNPNPKMLLTTQQQTPLVLLQRTNFESKNLQAPSRLSSQSKKSKDEVIADTSSKVVALKRLHQENCDENDFENLITENQIYGNKIVVKEKSQVSQQDDWKNKLKVDIKVDKPQQDIKSVVKPNFVYLSNVQFPGNLMMIKSNSKLCQTTDSAKMQISPNENRTDEANIVKNNNQDTSTILVKNAKQQTVTVNKEIHVLKSSNNVLQTLSNNNNQTEVVFQTNQKVIMTPQIVYQVPIVVTETDNKNKSLTVNKDSKVVPVPVLPKKELAKLVETKPDKVLICQVDTKLKPKIVIANLRPKVAQKVEEVSTLDMYENKKRLRRLKYLSNSNKDPKKNITKAELNVITPDKMKYEIFKELRKKVRVEESSDSESESGEDELSEYNYIIERFGENYNENAKVDFLAGFSLASKEVFREKQLERHERILKCDSIASAYIAAGHLDPQPEESPDTPVVKLTSPEVETKWTKQKKHLFLAHFKLMQVSPWYKADYEKSWRVILRERNRRNGVTSHPSPEPLDPDGQLQMLTEINRSVHENNDLIKKRLDSICDENSDIRILAEKNFSELNRLSKMADRSVKLFSGKDTKKRDLNPGFDSENIKKFKIEPKNYHNLNIPSVSKIISLKSDQATSTTPSPQPTSMEEPAKPASCGVEEVKTKEVGCQSEQWLNWPGPNFFIKSCKEYQIGRKKEIDELYRRNTRLGVECAHITRSASTESDRARALLAELQNLAGEEAGLRRSLDRLTRAIAAVRNS